MNVESSSSTVRAWSGVLAITASLFVFLTTELMPVGILSRISSGLHIHVGVAALMVTMYGVSAGLGVPFIVASTRRVDRRLLLTCLLAVLAAGNLGTALAPDFALVLITRLLMGFANGVFWAIGVNMAMRLVPPHQAGRAAAVAMSGISVATVLGIPLGMFLEHLTSWRTTFLIWSGLSACVLAAVAVIVPRLPSDNAVPVREVLRLPFANPQLRAVLATITLFVLGQFAAFTFVRPYLERDAGLSATSITALLMIYGAGGAAGNFIAGHTARTRLRATFYTACTLLIAAVIVLLVVGHTTLARAMLLALWGGGFGAWQLAQLQLTQAAAPDTFEAAMSLNTLAYNTSIALGALFGGLFADSLGVPSALWFGVALTAGSLLTALASQVITHRSVGPEPGAENRETPADRDPLQSVGRPAAD